jgi:hypothetical protein
MTIHAVTADITLLQVDAIVNSANQIFLEVAMKASLPSLLKTS